MTAPVALVVDPDDPTPPYEQLRRQVRDLVGGGVLRPGDRLPPLRQLAGDLVLAVGTVARAYRELEADGLLTSRRGGGTRVSAEARALPATERLRRLDALATGFVAAARAGGAGDEDVLAATRAALGLSAPRRP